MKNFPFGLPGLFAAALVIGIAGDLLLRVGPPGANMTVWLLPVLGLIALRAHRVDALRDLSGRITLGAALIFALLFSWRDADALKLLLLFVGSVSVALTAAAAMGRNLRLAYVWDYLADGIQFILSSIVLPPFLLRTVQESVKAGGRPVPAAAFAVLRGILLAAPVLFVFGALLVSADALFESFVTNLFDFDIETVFSHVILAAFCAWAAAAAWWLCLEGGARVWVPRSTPDRVFASGAIEVNVALGLVNVLFLSFVAIQARYFFGGQKRVLSQAGLTYADYARRGFFELAAVAAISLALLLICARVLHGAAPSARRTYKALSGVLIGGIFVIIASALHRMNLYIDAYGLTQLRLYATAFTIWIAVLFLWLYAILLRDRILHFAYGFLLTGYAATFTVIAMNPDAMIARINLTRAQEGKPLDMEYISQLGADAVPALVKGLPALKPVDRVVVTSFLAKRKVELDTRPRRTWTLGLQGARTALKGEVLTSGDTMTH
jgi:hypothetical protein